jgi:macrolide transport system ATP-binding/permease protein
MRTWLYVLSSRLAGWLSTRRLDADFDDELNAHLAMLTDENIRRGMTREAAARGARMTLGGITQLKEDYRERRGLPWLDATWQDIRYACRTFLRNPGFTLMSILILTVGIGVNTTVFTLINAVVLKPLPVSDPGSLVRIKRWFDSGARGDVQYGFSYEEYTYYRVHARLVSSLIAVSWPIRVVVDGEALQAQVVSDDYFSALGVRPALGRAFLPEENRKPGANPVVVLSDRLWRRRFQADPGVVGRTLALNATTFTVIGVAPADFIGTGNPPQVPDFWAPLMMQAQLSPGFKWLDRPNIHRLQLLARVAPDAPVTQARAELEVLASQVTEQVETSTPHDRTIALELQPATYFGGTDDGRFQAGVALLMTLLTMVLLVACANLANMLLARAVTRQREIAVRLALGASRGRLLRQLLTESVLLAAFGGAAGLAASLWASHALWTIVDRMVRVMFLTDQPFVASLSPDLRVGGFAVAISLATGVLFGLSPALKLSKSNLGGALKDEGSAFSDRISRSRLRTWLIGAQVFVSIVFLVCAGLLMRGLVQSRTADPGFDARRIFMVFMSLGTDPVNSAALQRRIVDRLGREPELQGVTLVDRFPFGGTWSPPVRVEHEGATRDTLSTRTLANYVAPGYFETVGVPLLRGRTFTRLEAESGASVAVVSASAARTFWPGEDPLGKRVKIDMNFKGQLSEFEVVGVAKDVRTANLSRVDPAYVYLPTRSTTSYNLLIRSERGAAATLSAVRSAVGAVDDTLVPTVIVTSVHDGPLLKIQLVISQVLAVFAGTLACLALVLAAAGIYGVTAYHVSQRTREIGIRMALGANAADVRRLVVGQAMTPALAGGALGLVAAAGVASVLRATLVSPASPDLMFGIGAFDPATFIGVAIFLMAVTALASYIPARRAVSVDPLVALRYE